MKRFFRFVIPSILAMCFFSLYTMIDGYFVANYVGEIEFAAVNISMPVITSFFCFRNTSQHRYSGKNRF